MAVKSPGDALPCSIPQANAEKLRTIGAKSPVTGVLPDSALKRPDVPTTLAVASRTIPATNNPPLGRQVDLRV